MPPKTNKSDFTRLLELMGPLLGPHLVSVTIHSAVIAFCFNIILAFLIRDVMNAAAQADQTLLRRAVILALVTFLGGTPVLILTQSLCVGYIKRTMTNLRVMLFQKITTLPVSRFESQQNGRSAHSGDLLSRATNDLDQVEAVYFGHLENVLVSVLGGILAVIPMFVLDWRLAAISMAVGIVQMLTNLRLARGSAAASDALQGKIGRLTERLSDLLQSLTVSKMFNLEETVHARYQQEARQVASATYRLHWFHGVYRVLEGLFTSVSSLGLVITGLFLALNGQVDIGTVASFLFFTSWIGYAFGGIGWVLTDIQSSLSSARRVFEILDAPAEPERCLVSSVSAASSHDPNLAVELKDLSFRYEGTSGGENASGGLHGISLGVGRGQVAALVGPSGGGKSTLIKLLMGFYPPDSGEMWLDGLSLAAALTDLRARIAYVPQEAYLFEGTIAENIRYGKPDAAHAEVEAAARAANAHDFILEQPQGYDTRVGERGAKLSGGQRQRIAIARALLKNAPILLLDEATSALDSESEREVQASLEMLMQGRTTLAVAHRLSTILKADCIYVLDQGRIVEKGTHQELVNAQGLYARLAGQPEGQGSNTPARDHEIFAGGA